MYAQTNYSDIQGINGKYTIAQIGCFITSFCNLEERFGNSVSPPTLNAYLRDKGFYIDVDDGVRDDVSWDTITSYDSRITVTGTGNGAPPSDNAIVKFVYKSYVTGSFTTHFCLVNSAAGGTIIDSWDGKVKNWTVYGGPVAYATYSYAQSNTPQGGDMASSQFINQVFDAVLGRAPDPGALQHYGSGQYSAPEFVLDDVMKSKEHQQYKAGIGAAYATAAQVPALQQAIAARDAEIADLRQQLEAKGTGTSATPKQLAAEQAINAIKDALGK